MLADVPRSRGECGDESAGEDAARLQRSQAEYFSGMCGVVAPVIDDVKNLGADDSAEDDQDAEVPCVIAIDSPLLGVADADPEAD